MLVFFFSSNFCSNFVGSLVGLCRYVYDPKMIGAAHEWARTRAVSMFQQALSPVIVDNTNTMCWEAKAYVEPALACGYEVEVRIR